MKGRTALFVACAALLVLGLTGSASAAWTHKGKGELKENASLALSGTVTLSTSAGNVACPTTVGTTLTASSSSGHVESFAVSKASECDLTGSLAAICGTNGVTKVEKTGTWALAADENDITLTGIDVHYAMAGCLIPGFRVKGSSTLTLDKANAIGTATLSGTQTLYNALGEESGSGELKGTLTASPAGTYGVKTAATVETRWTDANSHLSEDGKLTLSGTFSFSGTGGGISCPATVKLLLESSTVEEEEAEGEIESFAVAEPSKCDITGSYASSPCTTNSISKVEQTGTATLTATEEDITISGLVIDYKFEKCPITSLRVQGNPTVSVSSPESIASATFGGSLDVYNAESEKIGTATAGGSPSASPSGTFQLTADAKEAEETTHEAETEAASTEPGLTFEHLEEEAGPWWVSEGNTEEGTTLPSEEEAVAIEGEGAINNTSATGLVTGPCETAGSGSVWNDETMGEGQFTSFTIVTPCETNIPGCSVITATANASNETPWPITLTTTDTIDIYNVTLTNHYAGAGCEAAGVPTFASMTGTLTGTLENDEGPSGQMIVCINLNNHLDDLKVEVSGSHVPVPVNLTGSFCIN